MPGNSSESNPLGSAPCYPRFRWRWYGGSASGNALTGLEKAEVVAICDYLRTLKFSPGLPNAVTEHGTMMVARVLNTPRAIVLRCARLREVAGNARSAQGVGRKTDGVGESG